MLISFYRSQVLLMVLLPSMAEDHFAFATLGRVGQFGNVQLVCGVPPWTSLCPRRRVSLTSLLRLLDASASALGSAGLSANSRGWNSTGSATRFSSC